MIHVAYRLWGGDGFFAKMCGVSMLSMFENTKEKVTVHIMHNERLTPENRGKFCYIAGQYNQRVEFHNVEKISGATMKKLDEAYPLPSEINASWYPIITHEVFPNLDKIILLGADTVFNLDVAELWYYNLEEWGGVGLAAVPEVNADANRFQLVIDGLVDKEDYFNADVLLIAPKFFAENFDVVLEGCKFVSGGDNRKYFYCEQDILNYLFSKKYLKLPFRFNAILADLRKMPPVRLERAIYHYAGAKPDLNIDDVFNRLYFEYFLKTPWAKFEMLELFGNLDKAIKEQFHQIINTAKDAFLHILNVLADRQRAFFVDKSDIDALKKTFKVKDDELVIDASQPDATQILLDEMNKARGEKIFFLLVSNYVQVAFFLIQHNFSESVDFFNAMAFLSERYGFKVNFDTTQIVQEM